MIRGSVNTAHEAVVALTLQGPTGRTLEMDTVVDTGFDLFLTLPSAVVTELGSAFIGVKRAVLADGSMALLHGHSLYIEVEEGGRVLIQAMQP